MPDKIAVVTIFTFLLFAGATARIALDQVSTSLPESVAVSVADSNTVVSTDKPKSEFDGTAGNDRLPESERTQNIDVSTVDSTQRLNFARIHFFDKNTRIPLRFVRRHPCRKFQRTYMIPPTKISYGNDMILSDKTDSFDPKAFGDQIPTKWLKFKHKYGHRRHHHHNRVHDADDELELNSFSRHHKEKKREHEGGFMKRIRKFLKHTFD